MQQIVLKLFGPPDDWTLPSFVIDRSKVNWSDTYPSNAGILPRDEIFSVFRDKHMEEASAVYNFLISQDSFENFVQVAQDFKAVLNGGVFLYILTVALLHRKDTQDLSIPPLWQVNPYNFFSNAHVKTARSIAGAHSVPSSTVSPALPFVTGTLHDPEHKMAWWREDIGLNAHHMHWHQVR